MKLPVNKKPYGEIMIWIDNREKRSIVPARLERMGVEVKYANLPVADYIVQGLIEIPVERKAVNDYVASLVSGRLNNELYRLSYNYPYSLLIVEGFIDEVLLYRNIKRQNYFSSLVGSFIKTSQDGKSGIVHLITVSTPFDTALVLYYLDKKVASEEEMIRLPKAEKHKVPDEKRLVYIVASLPDIGEVKAEKLLNHFGNLKNLINASPQELMKVPGIGKKTAQKLYDLFNKNVGGDR